MLAAHRAISPWPSPSPPYLCILLGIILTLTAPALPARADVTDDDVDLAIKQGIEAILARQHTTWVLVARHRDGSVKTYKGQVLRRSGGAVRFRPDNAGTIDVPADRVVSLTPPGAFAPEMTGIHQGGPSALATFALLSAGVPRTHPQIKQAIQYLAEVDMPGTYSRALRANIWALLLEGNLPAAERSRYRRMLNIDTSWLRDAMSETGWYDYGRPRDENVRLTGDNSCTQFGVLGMWAADNAGAEISRSYWRIVQDHWLSTQRADGSWYYGRGNNAPRETMTVAGINTLYILLDKLYAQSGTGYKRFLGVTKTPDTRQGEQLLLQAIARGLDWMNDNMQSPRAVHAHRGYRQFGMERLGLASGLKYLGGNDWYRRGAEFAVRRRWTGDLRQDPFWLLFLVYGDAPILFNKLALGPESSWNYYLRDLHSLCRYLTRKYERIHKWQVVSLDSSAHDLDDAPFLYVNGTDAFTLSLEQRSKLRAFCDRGGTVIGHANLASAEFTESFRNTFEQIFTTRNWTLRPLPADHPVYRAAGRSRHQAVEVPVEGMSDGTRIVVFLFTDDIAGAWHRNLTSTQQDLFDVMADIRHYASPPYHQLPRRLRPPAYSGPPAAPVGTIVLARLGYSGQTDLRSNPTAWDEMNTWCRHHRGITIDETRDLQPADVSQLNRFDIIHIAGRGRWNPDPALQRALLDYIDAGGLVLADAVGGDPDFRDSFRAFLAETCPGPLLPLTDVHPIVSGTAPGGAPLNGLRPTLWSLEELGGRRVPPLLTVPVRAGTGLIFCPWDVTVSINGHYVYGLRGYDIDSTRNLVANILAWRIANRPPTSGATQATQAEPRDRQDRIAP